MPQPAEQAPNQFSLQCSFLLPILTNTVTNGSTSRARCCRQAGNTTCPSSYSTGRPTYNAQCGDSGITEATVEAALIHSRWGDFRLFLLGSMHYLVFVDPTIVVCLE